MKHFKTNLVRKYLFFLIVCHLCQPGTLIAQMGPDYSKLFYLADLQGSPLTEKLVNGYVDGSPFFKSDWLNATLVEKSGNTYKDIKIKMDLLEHRIYFLDPANAERELTSPAKFLILNDPTQLNPLTFIELNELAKQKTESGKWWSQLLIDGNIKLLKNYNKIKYESKGYTTPGLEISVKDEIRWFLVKDEKLFPFKKQKELIDLLKADAPAMTGFTAAAKNPEAQFIEIVKAYNTIKASQ